MSRSELSPKRKKRLVVVSGGVHPELGTEIAASMGVELGEVALSEFYNGEQYVRYPESVRGKDVMVIQSQVRANGFSVNDAIMQQRLMIHAARLASAREITAVAPIMAYARQDRKSKGREPISIALQMRDLATAGAKRIVTVDLHSPQSQAIHDDPFDHLTAQPMLRKLVTREVVGERDRDGFVAVAADAGGGKAVEVVAKKMGVDALLMSKSNRTKKGSVEHRSRYPEVDGRVCTIFDDQIATAGTIRSAADTLHDSGASEIYVAATHGYFTGSAYEWLLDSPIDRLYVTDTIPLDEAQAALGDMLQVVPIAGMIGRALIEIAKEGSVSKLFGDENHR